VNSRFSGCSISDLVVKTIFIDNKLRITLMTRINFFLIRGICAIRCFEMFMELATSIGTTY